MITRMDRDIGRLADLIRERGLEQRTLVMFISDNGPHREGGADPEFFKSSGGLRGIKRDLYEGGIRVPMIAQWTGHDSSRAGQRSRLGALGRLPDARRYCRCEDPAGLDGVSMARALRGQAQPAQEFLTGSSTSADSSRR